MMEQCLLIFGADVCHASLRLMPYRLHILLAASVGLN